MTVQLTLELSDDQDAQLRVMAKAAKVSPEVMLKRILLKGVRRLTKHMGESQRSI